MTVPLPHGPLPPQAPMLDQRRPAAGASDRSTPTVPVLVQKVMVEPRAEVPQPKPKPKKRVKGDGAR